MNELTELQHFLDNNIIPRLKRKPKTFLGIAKQPHYENVWSNIYAFFFKVNEEHGLKYLFINSLIECIDETIATINKRQSKVKVENEFKIVKDFRDFKDFDVQTEFGTKGIVDPKTKILKTGRIDLLLSNKESAIIIENKVYHHLDNNLDDYWDSVELETDSTLSKIGILLSLKPISKDNYTQFKNSKEYISITHLEFMQCVIKNLGPYLLDANKIHVVFLQDFYQNILNISQPTMSKENINFYFENKNKINDLVKFKYQFKQHVITEVEKAGNSIANVKMVAPRSGTHNFPRLRYYQSTLQPNMTYTIVFDDILKGGNTLHIIIEPTGKALKERAIFKKIKFEDYEVERVSNTFYDKTDKGWVHFASKPYFLNKEDLSRLGEFIKEKINDDHFKSIFNKLENYLLENPIR